MLPQKRDFEENQTSVRELEGIAPPSPPQKTILTLPPIDRPNNDRLYNCRCRRHSFFPQGNERKTFRSRRSRRRRGGRTNKFKLLKFPLLLSLFGKTGGGVPDLNAARARPGVGLELKSWRAHVRTGNRRSPPAPDFYQCLVGPRPTEGGKMMMARRQEKKGRIHP